MSGKLRKSQAHTARKQRHADARRDKREATRSHSKQTPRSERNRYNTFPSWLTSSNMRNPAWWSQWGTPAKQWTRSKVA